ncbi:MAG: hypothetical protein MMC23_000531 [Stictis urceolatum]|nr:hypothetical protein [Stictis urceolata]
MDTSLRRRFKYPDEDEEPEVMDEEGQQQQEQLIKKLQKEHADKNEEWIRVFIVLIMTAVASFLPVLVSACRAPPRYIAVMGMSSLFATAYNLVLVPNKHGGKDPLAKFAQKRDIELSPLQRYLPYLNGILAPLIGAWGNSWKRAGGVHQGFWIVCWLPTIMYCIVFMVKRFLIEVDPEELEQMRYEWKGA